MNEEFRQNNENLQNDPGPGDMCNFAGQSPDEPPCGPAYPPAAPAKPAGEETPGFLELVYGVLFEPGKTMERVVLRPPLGMTLLIVTILSLLGATMGLLTASRALDESFSAAVVGQFLPALQAMAPFAIILGLLWGYVKWFGYSAIIHLAADLLGGRGSARGVFAVTGLAGLPAIFMVPLQFLAYWIGTGNMAATVLLGLAGLAVGIWSIILLVIGLKQAHALSTGRSLLVVLSPVLVLVVFGILIMALLVTVAALMPTNMHLPGYL